MARYNSLCMTDNTSHSRLDGCWELSSRRDLGSMQSFKDPGSCQLAAPASSRSTRLSRYQVEREKVKTAQLLSVTLVWKSYLSRCSHFTGKPESHDPTWRSWAWKCDLSVCPRRGKCMRVLETAPQQPHMVPGQFLFFFFFQVPSSWYMLFFFFIYIY